MASPPPSLTRCVLVVTLLVMATAAQAAMAAEEKKLLYDQVKMTWGEHHSFFYMDGDEDTLAPCLDEYNGSGFASEASYLYGRFDIDMKLVANNSAGTVTTLYVSFLKIKGLTPSPFYALRKSPPRSPLTTFAPDVCMF
jgi:xyloglucan:xyloglucosyl transferase